MVPSKKNQLSVFFFLLSSIMDASSYFNKEVVRYIFTFYLSFYSFLLLIINCLGLYITLYTHSLSSELIV
ncbi:hypothetical protein BDA99DRAFT_503129 [Phascolomyces articulosus]|uniref:Uncharacterized protein n=1 Tax=Phascolomyces articulosus TaxID=60185 RepID=A0AAD5PG35_9FUNG|nr:hypothetical protein BDA99DRAFT_503129 [Phascolomyces articulosus]